MTVRINPNAHAIVASMCGDDPIMDETAIRILMLARASAAEHRLTGQYMHNLKVIVAEDRHGKDRLIVADDPGAVPIEFGHWSRPRRRGRQATGQRLRTWVPGLHIMGKAYGMVRRVR